MVTIIEEGEDEEEEPEKEEEQSKDAIFGGASTPAERSSPAPPLHLPENSLPSSPAYSDHSSHAFSPNNKEATTSKPPDEPLPPVQLPYPVAAATRSLAVRDESLVVTPPQKPDLHDGFSARDVDVGAGRAPACRGDDGGSSVGGGRWRRPTLSILKRAKRESMLKKATLALRVCGFTLCLISFSVMAADRNTGWALDSFDRYKEFRYCLSVTVIAAAYSALQVPQVLMDGGKILAHHPRCYFNFVMDQILAYLLLSSSSSAAIRVDDWRSNWGSDKFPEFASVAVSMSFLAFVAFALSSLISGYTITTLVRS